MRRYAPAFLTFQGTYAAATHADAVDVVPPGHFWRRHEFAAGTAGRDNCALRHRFWADIAASRTRQSGPCARHPVPATIRVAGLVAAGAYQFNVVVPALPDGDHPVIAEIEGVGSPSGLFIPVRQ